VKEWRSDRINKSHDITSLLRSDVHGTRELGVNISFAKGKEFGSRKERGRSGSGRSKTDQTRAGRIGDFSRIPKVHCLVRLRSSRMGLMIGFDNIRGIGKFVSHDPFIFFVGESFPGYEVLDFSSTFPRGKNLFYFLFFYSVNNVRRWRWRNLLRGELGCVIRVEETFVEDWMDSMPFGI